MRQFGVPRLFALLLLLLWLYTGFLCLFASERRTFVIGANLVLLSLMGFIYSSGQTGRERLRTTYGAVFVLILGLVALLVAAWPRL